jgi:hypothetical protein
MCRKIIRNAFVSSSQHQDSRKNLGAVNDSVSGTPRVLCSRCDRVRGLYLGISALCIIYSVFMPLSSKTLALLRPVPPVLRRPSLLKPDQQQRIYQTISADSHTLLNSYTKGYIPHSFPRLHSLTKSFNSRNRAMAATTTSQTRSHSGHHHHHHDNTYLTSTNKNDAGVRITRIGLYSNLGMAVAKGVGGYAFNSQSMIADAWHSLTDLASDILTLATVSWSLKPPTPLFPTGFGKVESLGSLGVSGMLLFGGCFMCLNSCEILYAHFFLDAHAAAEVAAHAHGHSHSHGAAAPSLHAAWLAAGTVIFKEWLYQASKKPRTFLRLDDTNPSQP